MAEDHPVDPDQPVYMYIQIAEHIAGRVQSGQLRPGARLPGERDLADEYQVALGTARRAIKELRSRGVVTTLPSRGTYITNQQSSLEAP